MADQPSVMESEKPKKKSIIVWQCLNPECTTTNKKILRWVLTIKTCCLLL